MLGYHEFRRRDLRRDAIATRQADLDLAARLLDHDDDRDLAFARLAEPLRQARHGVGRAKEHAKPARPRLGEIVELADLLHSQALHVAELVDVNLHLHAGAGLQERPHAGQRFRERDHFHLAGGVGDDRDAHAAAVARARLVARDDDAGKLPGRRSAAHRLLELRDGLRPEPPENRFVFFERVAGEERADGVVFAGEPLGRKPGLHVGQAQGLRLAAATEQLRLAVDASVLGAGRDRHDCLDGGMDARPVGFELVEGAGRGQAFEGTLVDGARADPRREVCEVAERPVAAHLDEMLDRVAAHVAQGGQRIVDHAVLYRELHPGPVDRRRCDLDAHPGRLTAEQADLLGRPHVERHRRREELGRKVRLQIRRLVGDERVGGGMRLVEAVVGELRHQFEDVFGLGLGDAPLDRASDEALALLLHFRADLLAHGAAQEIGFAKRVARELLRNLHHLFLVDDDAVGLLQDRLHLGMDVVGIFTPMLAVDVGRDVGHRAGPIQGDQRRRCPRSGRASCSRMARRACRSIPAGTRRPSRRATASRRSSRRRAAAPPGRLDVPRSRHDARGVSSTVSVFRPRKSNFTRPAASVHFMLNCVAGMPERGSR